MQTGDDKILSHYKYYVCVFVHASMHMLACNF